MNVKEIIDLILKSIEENTNFFQYRDMIIIGENTSGKSMIIKQVIKNINNERIYFIDVKNRTIPTKDYLIKENFDDIEIKDLLSYRVERDVFNKKDVFLSDKGSEVVLSELISNISKYKELFKRVLNIDLIKEKSDDFVRDEIEEIQISNVNLREISSGIQSMLRILMEVNFANEKKCEVILIDEFNINLDYETSSSFFIKLRENYPNLRFIITSHDIYTLQGIDNSDVLRVYKTYESQENNLCEFFDSNDLDNLELIDRKLFNGVKKKKVKDDDIFLRNIFKLAILGKNISEENKEKIIGLENLTLKQKIIKDFIIERSEK